MASIAYSTAGDGKRRLKTFDVIAHFGRVGLEYAQRKLDDNARNKIEELAFRREDGRAAYIERNLLVEFPVVHTSHALS